MTVPLVIAAGAFMRTPTIFTGGGSLFHYQPPRRASQFFVVIIGAGGGGGGASTTTNSAAAGAGGASGAVTMQWFYGVQVKQLYTFTIGTKGSAGGSGGTGGGSGTATTMRDYPGGLTNLYLSVSGGGGGGGMAAGTSAAISAPGTIGTVAGADINIPSQPGMPGIRHSGSVAESGAGGGIRNLWLGHEISSCGGVGRTTGGAGNDGAGFGAGGGGGLVISNSGAVSGGAGVDGAVIIYEFF